MIVTNNGQGGALPKVEDRGSDLDGSSYLALGKGANSAPDSQKPGGEGALPLHAR